MVLLLLSSLFNESQLERHPPYSHAYTHTHAHMFSIHLHPRRQFSLLLFFFSVAPKPIFSRGRTMRASQMTISNNFFPFDDWRHSIKSMINIIMEIVKLFFEFVFFSVHEVQLAKRKSSIVISYCCTSITCSMVGFHIRYILPYICRICHFSCICWYLLTSYRYSGLHNTICDVNGEEFSTKCEMWKISV